MPSTPSAGAEGLWGGALTARPLEAATLTTAAVAAVSDHLASSLAARGDEGVARLLAWATPVADGRPVPGHDVRLLPEHAALAAGAQAHALDLDDTHAEVRGHPSAVLLPALFALATPATPGAELLTAYAVGVDVMARLGRIAGRTHHVAGWHPTATLGGVAAAVAGARLTGLDPRRTEVAAALAASQAGGVRAQFGSAAKPLHAGLAAAAGVRAVQWAAAGFDAEPGALLGSDGMAQAYGFAVTGDEARAVLADRWGERWAVVDPGLWVKRFPFCSAAMSAHEAAEQLSTLDVVSATVTMRPGSDAPLRYRLPQTGTQGRFSLEYLVALGLLGVTPTEDRFTTLHTGALELAGRIERRAEGHPSREPWARVDVRLPDGRALTATVGVPLGAPGRPLDAAARRDKLRTAVGDAADDLAAAVALLPTTTVGDLEAAVARATRGGDR